MAQQRTVLILMSDTGGGHRASAQALQAGLEFRCGSAVRVEIVDLLKDRLPWPLCRLPNSYAFLSGKGTWLWRLLWNLGESPGMMRVAAFVVARWTHSGVRSTLQEFAPDLVVSVHPLVQGIVLYTLERMDQPPPFVTVVTDLATAHPLWFHPNVQRCYVASEEAYRRARRRGIPSARLRQFGLPLRLAFSAPLPPRDTLRRRLGLDPNLPAVLLIGGGEGIGPVASIARHVSRALASAHRPGGQLVIVCGRNRRLYQQLHLRRWPVPVQIQGFVDNMHEWMAACDCIITKAGPGTIAESLVCGLPLILSGYIPGQEEGNVAFVLDNRVGIFKRRAEAIGRQVARWFGAERSELNAMQRRAQTLGQRDATLHIVDDFLKFLYGDEAVARKEDADDTARERQILEASPESGPRR